MGQAMAQAVEVLMARVKEVAILIPASRATKVIRGVSSSRNPDIRVTQSS